MYKVSRICFILICVIFYSINSFAQAVEDIDKFRYRETQHLSSIDLSKNNLENESRLGLDFNTGNTRSFAATGNHHTLWRIKRFEQNWNLGGNYYRIFSSSRNTAVGTTENYIFGTFRLDYYFLPRTTVYVGGGGYSDRIQGIDSAGRGFTGISHYFIANERLKFRGQFGYDFTHEERIGSTDNEVHSITSALGVEYLINDFLTFTSNVHAWQNAVHGYDFRLDHVTELETKINSTFSVVVSENIRFDNQPVPGFRKMDTRSKFLLQATY